MSHKLRLFFFLTALVVTTKLFGQAPVITHVDKYINRNAQRVTISGSNFGAVPANLVVWFGAVRGTVVSATDQTIEATVPPGATYESIVVTNTSTGKSAWSKNEFQLSYGGEQPFALSNLISQTDLAAESGLYDVCLCDLDGDGKPDVAASNSGTTSAAPAFGASLFRNTSTPGTFAFAAKTSVLSSAKVLNIKCGDLNGDGKKDLVLTEADPGNRVFILRNTSTTGTLSFATQNVSLAGKSPKRAEIVDLDRDGLPELIVTDQNTENKQFVILPNTSSGATISFGSPLSIGIPVTGNSGSDGLAVQDMDGDNFADIIISQVLSSSGNVWVYKNESRVGNFIFTKVTKADIAPATPNNTGAPVNVRAGDIDGDGKTDLVVSQFLGSKVTVVLNQSTGTTMQFGSPVTLSTDIFPFGVDLGDLDGDGKLDIVAASLTGPVTETNPKSLTILNNTSSPGNVSFAAKLSQPTAFVNRHVVVGDIDGDSKPDITYTSVDDNTRGVPASKVSFFRNKSCIKPVVTPEGPLVLCTGFLLPLEGSVAPGATYVWKLDNVAIGGATTSSYSPTATGSYVLEITSDGCTRASNAVNVTMSAGSAAAPTFTNNSPLCEGGTITITASSVGGTSYNWKGPGNFTATGATINRGPYVPSFAGRYEVEVMAGACIAAKGSALVETISLPQFVVGFTGSDIICAGDTKVLTASPNDTDFTYQWANGNVDIAGATLSSYTANATGAYGFKAKSTLYPGCPEVTATAVTMTTAAIPTVAFQSPAETCVNTVVTFVNQSTLDNNAGANYLWEFGDATTSTDSGPTHTYTAINNYTVKLSASYRGGACLRTLSKPIKVSAPPTASITTPGNVFKVCAGGQLTLAVNPSFAEYLWSNNATTPTINVSAGGTYSVQLKSAIGCQINASQAVTQLPSPAIEASATPNPINQGQTAQLSATSGLTDYQWTPSESLDASGIASPVASPKVTTTYSVSAKNADGCAGQATVELVVVVESPTNLLKPANFFSPNSTDNINPTWLVENILDFPECNITIFDEKGSKVYEAQPYLNDWDGTSTSGKRLPDGVYYYVIRCEGDSKSKTGSITLLR